MKKISNIIILISIIFCLSGCTATSLEAVQPGSIFTNGEQQYILVDTSTQQIGNEEVVIYIYYDKSTYMMYQVVVSCTYGPHYVYTWTPLLNTDGTPRLYETDPEKTTKIECEQPDSFFPDSEQRYGLIDYSTQVFGEYTVDCYICYDKYTMVMYEFMVPAGSTNFDSVSFTQIEYEDGSPMLYDGGNW